MEPSKLGDSLGISCGYYPDALPLTLGCFHPKTGKLYGAQCIGYEGSGQANRPDSRTHQAGWHSLRFDGDRAMPVISWRELVEEKDKVMLIDTHTPEEFSFGTIPGAVNIPLDEMREHLAEYLQTSR